MYRRTYVSTTVLTHVRSYTYTCIELVAGALAGLAILGVNLPKYGSTFQNFRDSSQNFRTSGGLFRGFGYLTPLHGLNHWPAGQPANGRNFRPARPTPDLVVGHKL